MVDMMAQVLLFMLCFLMSVRSSTCVASRDISVVCVTDWTIVWLGLCGSILPAALIKGCVTSLNGMLQQVINTGFSFRGFVMVFLSSALVCFSYFQ